MTRHAVEDEAVFRQAEVAIVVPADVPHAALCERRARPEMMVACLTRRRPFRAEA